MHAVLAQAKKAQTWPNIFKKTKIEVKKIWPEMIRPYFLASIFFDLSGSILHR